MFYSWCERDAHRSVWAVHSSLISAEVLDFLHSFHPVLICESERGAHRPLMHDEQRTSLRGQLVPADGSSVADAENSALSNVIVPVHNPDRINSWKRAKARPSAPVFWRWNHCSSYHDGLEDCVDSLSSPALLFHSASSFFYLDAVKCTQSSNKVNVNLITRTM